MLSPLDDLEAELARLIRAKTFDAAATRAIDSYGPEVLGFLVNLMGSEAAASEVYSQVGEDIWNGLPTFAGRSSVRTWLYTVARHAAARYRRTPWNRSGQRTGDSRLDEAIERSRSRTQPWLRTEVKNRFAQLREALDPDDRTLLVLRVDRNLPWEDIARVMLGEEASDTGAVNKECARLRKRFQTLKEELKQRAREAGLIDDEH